MDRVHGAKHVIVMMEHVAREAAQDRQRVHLPITGKHCAQQISTEMAVIGVTESGAVLRNSLPAVSVHDVPRATERRSSRRTICGKWPCTRHLASILGRVVEVGA